MFRLKRVYETPSPGDGTRVLVERLWPRGLTKDEAKVDLWLKEIAPSAELRKWFGHDADRWEEFKRRYTEELEENPDPVKQLKQLGRKTVTLIYAARDEEHNSAVVLKGFLAGRKRKAVSTS